MAPAASGEKAKFDRQAYQRALHAGIHAEAASAESQADMSKDPTAIVNEVLAGDGVALTSIAHPWITERLSKHTFTLNGGSLCSVCYATYEQVVDGMAPTCSAENPWHAEDFTTSDTLRCIERIAVAPHIDPSGWFGSAAANTSETGPAPSLAPLKDAGRSIQVTDAMRSAGASAMFRLLPVFEGGDPLEEVAGKVFYEMWLAFVEEERKP